MMVQAATDKSKSGLVYTVAVWASKMVQSPSENDTIRASQVLGLVLHSLDDDAVVLAGQSLVIAPV